MVKILFLTIMSIALIGAVFYFLMPDLIRYYKIETKNLYKEFKTNNHNIGEVLTVLAISLIIGGFISILYRIGQSVVAYTISEDLIDFFIKSRGVFSNSGVDRQNPFLVSNVFYGLIISPILQFSSIYLLVELIKKLMIDVNRKFNSEFFSATSLVYFSSFGVLTFVIIDVVFYLQSVSFLNSLTNIMLLIGSKTSYVLLFFSVLNIQLLKYPHYKNVLIEESIFMYRFEKTLVLNPMKLVTFTFIVSIALQAPLYIGAQWNLNILIVILVLLLSIGLFYVILKVSLSNVYNYIGVFMLDDNRDHSLNTGNTLKIKKLNKVQKTLLYIAGFVLILYFYKEFFFFSFYIFLISFVILFLVYFSYALGSLISSSKPILSIPKQMLLSLLKVFSFPLAFLFLTLLLYSSFPKEIINSSFKNYQSAVFDENENLIFRLSTKNQNPSIPILYEKLPYFFIKALILKEDNSLNKQNDFFFNRSNWHGTSINFLLGRGGSNLNQQLIKNLAFKDFSPTELQRKFSELLSSLQLSYLHTPEEIIEKYVNNVSFNGGMGHSGVVNASYNTFGKNVNQINELEMLYLIATLHRGSTFKTEKKIIRYKEAHLHSSEIKQRLLKVYAEKWFENELITKKEIKKLRKQQLNFINNKFNLGNSTSKNTFLKNQLGKESIDTCFIYKTTLSKEINDKVLKGVRKFNSHFSNQLKVRGGDLYSTALVINVKKGEIIGHYGGEGSSDLTNFGKGAPMGSLIKPFVLLELLETGVNDIRLYDGKRKGKRIANNYNDKFSNKYLNESEILGPSKNAPLNNIDEITNPTAIFQKIESSFQKMGIIEDKEIDLSDKGLYTWNRINYPLGSRRMSIINIAQAYQTLLNNGEYIKLHSITSKFNPYDNNEIKLPIRYKNVFSSDNTKKIKKALRSSLEKDGTAYSLRQYLPKNKSFMIKTATTDGYKHGYTIISDGNILIVTWVSYGQVINKQLILGKRPIPTNSGGGSAGKLAAFIMAEIANY